MSTLDYSIRVLGIHEDGEWCAVALEMSLRGYGSTFEEALNDLHEAVEAQVSFAIQKDTLDNIWMPAEPHYVELYQQARRHGIREYLQGAGVQHAEDANYAAGDLALPQADRTSFEAVAEA